MAGKKDRSRSRLYYATLAVIMVTLAFAAATQG